MGEDERKRIERLQKQQIAARHPGDSKIRGYDWSQAAQRGAQINKKRKKRTLIGELFAALPGRWQGVIMGELVGIPGAIVIAAAVPDYWKPLAIIPPILTGIAGFVIGATITDN